VIDEVDDRAIEKIKTFNFPAIAPKI